MNTSGKLDQPRTFGRFVLTHRIAAGGMATVWKAQTRPGEALDGRPLAIKVLHAHLTDNEDFVRMFRDEGHLARQLEHANVVRVFEVDQVGDEQYLAMEYVEGRNVAQLITAARLNKTTLPAGLVFEILRQSLTALAYVHSVKGRNGRPLGIVHRDISPQNILISTDLIVKVTDFGIARGKHRSDQTRTGTVKGKLHYMAPEQAAGQRVDHRADLYALGAVAFEMLTGQPALGVDTTAVLQSRTVRGELDFSAKFRSQPEDVKAWLLKSLARLPDERFQSAEAMLANMEHLGKASRRYYKPEAMLQWLELDEARGSQQRRRELFYGDEAVASGRVQAGAISQQEDPRSEARRPPAPDLQRPISRIDVSPAERQARLQRSVDWSASDESALDVPAAARTGQRLALPAAAAMAASSQRRAIVAPAGAANREAEHAVPAKLAMTPASFAAPTQPPATESSAKSAPSGRSKPAAATAVVTRAEAAYQQGMAMSQLVAGLCTFFVLLAVALEVTGYPLDLPPVRDDMVASLWEETPARTDAVERSAPSAASASAHRAPVVKAATPPRIVPVVAPVAGPGGAAVPVDTRAVKTPAPDPIAGQLADYEANEPGSVAEEPASGSAEAEKVAPAKPLAKASAGVETDEVPADEIEAAPVASPVYKVLTDEERAERAWQGREIQTGAKPGEPESVAKARRAARTAAAAAKVAPIKPVPAAAPELKAAGKAVAARPKPAPVAAKPAAAKSMVSKPALAKSAVAPSAAAKPSVVKPAAVKPAPGKPVQGKTVPVKPQVAKPTPAKAAVAKLLAKPTKPAVAKTAGAKPATAKPVAVKPGGAKSTAAKPAAAPLAGKPSARQTAPAQRK